MVQVSNCGNTQTCCFLGFDARDMSIVVTPLSTCIRAVWMSSQKSASDVEPPLLFVEKCNASPRGIALMAMVTTVAVTSKISRFAGDLKISS